MGHFTVESAWNALRSPSSSVFWDKVIWHKFLPPRLSTLGRRWLHDKIPTDEKIQSGGTHLPSSFSTELWRKVLDLFNVAWTSKDSAIDMVVWWRNKGKGWSLKMGWTFSLLVTMAVIWNERNQRRYEGKSRSATLVLRGIKSEISFLCSSKKFYPKSVEDLIICRRLNLGTAPRSRQGILKVHWCKPIQTWVKLNVDGCSLGNPGRAGCGGIFRDHQGRMMRCFSFSLGVDSSFSAEIWSMIKGISIAQDLHISHHWIESNSSAAVSLFHHRLIPWFVYQEWCHLLSYLISVEWKITHCFREANPVADYLAKTVASSGASSDEATLPPMLINELITDEGGRPRYRFYS
ncbi:uncharacterized protein LOC122059130 [Macadamia integrifolia]|uniref:uncharacterized protein LOC122059130 n=1 Tax=Macadamia integrifolia TaxID=60698 RepID=UPI001C527855|nr:uncharacterized protein LOC122059130 [Macadamia integrifolia]